MKTVEDQLSQYKCVHLNPKNVKTHFVGIPLIVLSIAILLSLITFNFSFNTQEISISLAMILFFFALLYYLKLHAKLALGMMIYIVINVYLALWIVDMNNAVSIAIALFVIGWIIQFIGHHYEKAKPAFFDDIMGLVIGPYFLMAELYFAIGLEKELEASITTMAIEKRRVIERAKTS